MNIAGFEVARDIAAGFLIIAAVLTLALTNNIDGSAALLAILGVGAALGVYRTGMLNRPGGGENE